MIRVCLLLLAMCASCAAATERSAAAVYQFKKETGYLQGRPGYVVDHVVPLCAGGADAPENMQWQTIEEAKAKDRLERQLCRSLRMRDGSPESTRDTSPSFR